MLITLAIIGVVAAMTIPTLVANYQNKSWNTAATVFERKLEEALKTMNTQQTLAGYQNTEDFVNELSKHFKITKICKNSELTKCFEDTVFWGVNAKEIDIDTIKTAKHFGIQNWSINTEVIGFQTNNGVTGIVAYNPDCRQDPYSNQIVGTSCIAMLYDTSGFKNPNTSGKDLRGINVNSLGRNCALELNNVCYGIPFKPTAMSYEKCAGSNANSNQGSKGVEADTYAKSLGIERCYYERDYWAGAIEQCGGIQNIPSAAQVADIANYFYNTDKVKFQENNNSGMIKGITLDTSKFAEFNATFINGMWSNNYVKSSGTSAYAATFRKESTYYQQESRSYPGDYYYAVCIID